MNPRNKAILIGHILGDGYIYQSTKHGFSSLESKYSNKSLEYLLWLRDSLIELNPSEIKPHQNNQSLFRTKSSRDVGELRDIFYPEGVKIVPPNIYGSFSRSFISSSLVYG